jgi:A-kinase anchor protein 1
VATPPLRTPASGSSLSGDGSLPSVYEFVLPQYLVGRLIGRHGCFVHEIRKNTNASILIKRHPDTNKLKICAVEGMNFIYICIQGVPGGKDNTSGGCSLC